MNNKKGIRLEGMVTLVAVLALLTLALVACAPNNNAASQGGNQNPGVTRGGSPAGGGAPGPNDDISAKPAKTRQKVTLYFSDDQAMYLVPEERTVTKGDELLEAVIIRELISGPQKDNLERTIPEGTKLLSVSVVNGVAYVNFSKEFQTKHWGGSAGEIMTLYSVVNSLARLPGIEKVQFLLESDKKESILNGNMDTTVPLEPDYSLVAK
ncbi:GerMN domain-containing protein [Desulfallas thermosapovorans]|uniref:Sporulation and spore germination protein n=1 Tax=Desulfallas thermosapovorans DSM 6562 TaxID=1121431 RepID=A0A5S4ZRD9_9FIRM|nr:GerMN domain-containing protein [Desulfallas thermosapovorans]TYO95394.1 sporulation and spore germination protein [Desulfallas thermosapovorans DSM 6562]